MHAIDIDIDLKVRKAKHYIDMKYYNTLQKKESSQIDLDYLTKLNVKS